MSAAKKLPRYESLQPHYNLYERAGFEAALEPLCLKEGIGVIPYYSLASGFLTGKYRSRGRPRQEPARRRRQEIPQRRAACASWRRSTRSPRARRSKPGQVALAWLMARPSITAPIASATSLAQLEDLVAATRLKLDAEAIKQLDAASRSAPVVPELSGEVRSYWTR